MPETDDEAEVDAICKAIDQKTDSVNRVGVSDFKVLRSAMPAQR